MSIEALNQPPLVAVTGVVAMASLPAVELMIRTSAIPFATVKVLNGLLYGLNVYATSQPGRIDGIQQEELARRSRTGKEKIDDEKTTTTSIDTYSTGKRGRSLVSPEGWAFIIWAPIFLGELVFVTSSAFLLGNNNIPSPGSASASAAVVQAASGGFIVAQIMQTLWTAAFRPKYKGYAAHISTGLLAGIAFSLNRAHLAYAPSSLDGMSQQYTNAEYIMYFLPMSLHFGWTTAASLVNLNGNLAASFGETRPKAIAYLGHASAVVATALGVVITITRRAPVYGGVIAWALTACAMGMQTRLNESASSQEKDDPNRAGLYGASVQKVLCGVGAALSAAASAFVVYTSKVKSSKSAK